VRWLAGDRLKRVDGQTVMQARSVKYGPQKAELFQVPPIYTPALAPDGGQAEP